METWRALGPVDAALKKMRLRQLGGLVLAAAGILALLLTFRSGSHQSDPVPLDQVTGGNQPARFDISLLTEAFASDTADRHQYYLASDSASIRIVMLSSETLEKCQAILDYSYGVTDQQPQPITVTGVSAQIPDQLRQYAAETYQELFDPGTSAESAASLIGNYLLTEGQSRRFPIENIGLALFLGLAGVILFLNARTDRREALASLALAEEKGWIQPLREHFEQAAVFSRLGLISDGDILLTAGKIVNILPVSELKMLRCLAHSRNFALPMVVLQGYCDNGEDGRWITVASGKNNRRTVEEMNRLIALLHEQHPELEWRNEEITGPRHPSNMA